MRKSTLFSTALAAVTVLSSSAGLAQVVVMDPHHVVAPVPDLHPAIVDVHPVTDPHVMPDAHDVTAPEIVRHDAVHHDIHVQHVHVTPHVTHPPVHPPRG